MKKLLSSFLVSSLFLFVGKLNAQTTVLFSDNFESDSINSKAIGWELFGTANLGTVQYDSGTTNKILHLDPLSVGAKQYSGMTLQKTLDFPYGDMILSYRVRSTVLSQATGTTNCGNFNRIGFSGIKGSYNNDGNTAKATTTVNPIGFQNSLRANNGVTLTGQGTTVINNAGWFRVTVRLRRTSATTLSVSGTINKGVGDTLQKIIGGTIKTTTPTLFMNQFAIDFTALYIYNYVDIDDVTLSLPDSAPSATNLSINGMVQTLQLLRGSYSLVGVDTAGSHLQWLTAPTASGPFTIIPGATNITYTPARSDIGKYLAFRVYPSTASGFTTGIPVTAVTATPVVEHNGPLLIQSVRQTGNVAANSTVFINYIYSSPTNIPEKGTSYTVYVSDSFNLGYFKKLATGTTTAAQGIRYNIDTSLLAKYIYVELLPQDSTGTYGKYSGWIAQTAVNPEVQVLTTQYWHNGQLVNDFGIDSGSYVISATIRNNNLSHDTTGRLIVQLLDGFGNVVSSVQSAGVSITHNSQQKITTNAIQIPNYFEGYSIKVQFADSANVANAFSKPEKTPDAIDVNAVYQYFIGDGDSTNGAYLWIPPHTSIIKGYLITIKNSAEIHISEYSEVRKVCEKRGLASIVLTMWGKTFPTTLLTGLFYDYTNPLNSGTMDSIIRLFAKMSNHPELINAPYIATGHSAYNDFPFDMAMADNKRCIAAISLKAPNPNVYKDFLGNGFGGKSYTPSINNMKDVAIMGYYGILPETVDAAYKKNTERPLSGTPAGYLLSNFRIDDSTLVYKPGNEFTSEFTELYEGHFNCMPRALHVMAMFIDKACENRMPDDYPTDPNVKPVLKSLDYTKGWLRDTRFWLAHDSTKYNQPASYLSFKGSKKGAAWYFDEELARTIENLEVSEYYKQIEQLSILKPDGTPDTMYEACYNYHQKDGYKYSDSNLVLHLTPFSWDKPWPVDTASANTKDALTVPMKLSTKVVFPNITQFAITNQPIKARTNSSFYKHIGNMNFKLHYSRVTPAADYGGGSSVICLYKEGNDSVAATMRNVFLNWGQSNFKGQKSQFITFNPINTIDVNTRVVQLNATATSGLPVDFFVRSGPAYTVGNQMMITQIPEGIKYPIAIVVGAAQGGQYKDGGYSKANTIYSTVWLDKIAPAKPMQLNGNLGTNNINLNWDSSIDSTVNAYEIFRGDSLIKTTSDTSFVDTTLNPNNTYTYYVRSLNKLGNYSDTTNNVWITTPAPLPLRLVNFAAVLSTNNRVLCNWATANEINTAGFSVERSIDGQSFGSVGNVSAKGNTPAAIYKFTDVLPSANVSSYYYRLKMIDKTGKYSYSSIIKVSVRITPSNIHIAPNPFRNNLSLSIDATENTGATVMITSIDGKVLVNKKYTLTQGSNALQISEASRLAKGFYLLTIMLGYDKKTLSIEKQ